jgi:hypothetical protein
MPFEKDTCEFRYVFDIERGILHDVKCSTNLKNKNCDLENMESWVCFDTERTPVKGALIKKITAIKEVVDIEVRNLCPHCMSIEDENLVDLLQNYFLSRKE